MSTTHIEASPGYPLRIHAHFREIVGRSEIALKVSLPSSEKAMLESLIQLYPGHAGLLSRCRIAVDGVILPEDAAIVAFVNLDLITPISGG